MKNIFKKAIGILFATVMIFTMSTAVCAVEGIYSTENQNGYGMGLGDEVYTIDDSQSSNYGITADVLHKNLLSLETSKLSEKTNFVGFKNDAIVEVYDIKVNYSTTEQGKEVIKTTDDSRICGEMIISIPCDNPDLFVIDVSQGKESSYQPFQYSNGKYYIQTSGLGSFMLCTEPSLSPEVGQDFNMIQQTIVDENTGITVSGMIPEGAMMYTTFENITNMDTHNIPDNGWDSISIKYDYPLPSLREVFTKKTTDGKTKYDYSWYENNEYATGAMVVDIVFVKDYEIIQFDSELTVTLPLDYYKVLESCDFPDLDYYLEDPELDITYFDSPGEEYYSDGSTYTYDYYQEIVDLTNTDNIAKTFKLNPRTSNLEELEVITKTGGEDKFEFKINSEPSGTFFIGNKRLINNLVESYGWYYEDLKTFDKTANTTTTSTVATETVSKAPVETVVMKKSNVNNILLIICIATNALWIAVVTVLIVKHKKKKQ